MDERVGAPDPSLRCAPHVDRAQSASRVALLGESFSGFARRHDAAFDVKPLIDIWPSSRARKGGRRALTNSPALALSRANCLYTPCAQAAAIWGQDQRLELHTGPKCFSGTPTPFVFDGQGRWFLTLVGVVMVKTVLLGALDFEV